MDLNLFNLLLVLVAGWAGGALATRLGYPAVLGELLIGILLGPALLGWLAGGAGFAALGILAQIGVLLLMLYIGMEIDPTELGKASWAGLLAAIGGFATPFVCGYLVVVHLFDGTVMSGIFVGIAVGVTSLATKSRILLDLKILDTRIAHVMLAGALIADTISLVVFAGVIGFAEKQTLSWIDLGLLAARVAAFVVATLLVGRYVVPLLFQKLERFGVSQRGVYFMLLVVIAFAFGEAAELAGLHAILGTFAAGLVLREGMLEPKLDRELRDLVRDVSVGFLAPIFFVMAGFEVSLDVFRSDTALFAAIMVVAFVGKIAGTMLFYLPTGHGWREGLVLGAGMNGRGAVEIILAGIGLKLGLISREMFSILVFMAILTTATVPLFLKWGTDWLAGLKLLVRSAERRRSTLIIGAGPTARALAGLLRGGPVWLIDANIAQVEQARLAGYSAVHGSALDLSTLMEAQAPEAGRALAMTGNVEINALAARNLRETFLVPVLHMVVIGNGHAAYNASLEHVGATMLFGQPVSLSEWDHWFSQGLVRLERVPIAGRTAAEILRAPAITGDRQLILAVESMVDGQSRVTPFHSQWEASPGEGDNQVLIVGRLRTKEP